MYIGKSSYLYGQQERPDVLEQEVGEEVVAARSYDGDEVGDAQQWYDDQEGLGGLPVLVVVFFRCIGRGAELGDDHLPKLSAHLANLL